MFLVVPTDPGTDGRLGMAGGERGTGSTAGGLAGMAGTTLSPVSFAALLANAGPLSSAVPCSSALTRGRGNGGGGGARRDREAGGGGGGGRRLPGPAECDKEEDSVWARVPPCDCTKLTTNSLVFLSFICSSVTPASASSVFHSGATFSA